MMQVFTDWFEMEQMDELASALGVEKERLLEIYREWYSGGDEEYPVPVGMFCEELFQVLNRGRLTFFFRLYPETEGFQGLGDLFIVLRTAGNDFGIRHWEDFLADVQGEYIDDNYEIPGFMELFDPCQFQTLADFMGVDEDDLFDRYSRLYSLEPGEDVSVPVSVYCRDLFEGLREALLIGDPEKRKWKIDELIPEPGNDMSLEDIMGCLQDWADDLQREQVENYTDWYMNHTGVA